MRFYDSQSDGWTNLDGEDELQNVKALLVDFLKSKNLNILSGLGTSLTINDENDVYGEDYLAPTMNNLWTAIDDRVDDFKEIKTEVMPETEENEEENAVGRENGDKEENPDYENKQEDKNIEELLSRCQQYYNLEGAENIKNFIDEAEKEILSQCDFIEDGIELESHRIFLRRVAQRPSKLERTKIYTTNYDECFERAANDNRFHIIDGFSYLAPRTFDASYFDYDLVEKKDGDKALIPGVFHLYKLHGSINWKKKNGQIIQSRDEALDPCLIYPQSTKYELSYQQPYLELMNRFQIALRQPNTALIVIGFGFNDDHLARPIINALRSNVNLKVLVVDPKLDTPIQEGDEELNEYLVTLKKLIDNNDTRISLLEAKFDKFVKIIPDIAHKSDKDRMIESLQKIVSQGS